MSIRPVCINTFHGDKWRVTFSSIPGKYTTNPSYYDNFIKSIVIPDYNIATTRTEFMGFGVNHPMGANSNRDLSPLQIEFKLSEDMINYFSLFYWMQQVRYGDLNDDYVGLFRKYAVEKIIVESLDNQKRTVAKSYFSNALLVGLGSLPLVYGSSDEVTFSTSWVYEEILFDEVSILN